jgi:ProP effector
MCHNSGLRTFCPGGEIGRLRGLKIPRRKACRFESGPGHHLITQVNHKPRTLSNVAGFLLPSVLPALIALYMSSSETNPDALIATSSPLQEPKQAKRHTSNRQDVLPVLDSLASLYPHLFGTRFLPMKRGIFQELLLAHPEALAKDTLKSALAMHTRSTRYLNCVAEGTARFDLAGQAAEPLAPEHKYQAMMEVFKRRQSRSQEDLMPVLVKKLVDAIERSGLNPEAYDILVRSRDDTANAALDQALVIVKGAAAKDEALLRALEKSGQTVQAFADMYGLDPRAVQRTVDRAALVQANPQA